jgi:hypothetical protein
VAAGFRRPGSAGCGERCFLDFPLARGAVASVPGFIGFPFCPRLSSQFGSTTRSGRTVRYPSLPCANVASVCQYHNASARLARTSPRHAFGLHQQASRLPFGAWS